MALPPVTVAAKEPHHQQAALRVELKLLSRQTARHRWNLRMSDTDSSAADPLTQIFDEFVEAVRRGERPSVEEFARRYPAHADEIRDMLPALVHLEKAKAVLDAPKQPPLAAASSAVAPLQQLGDYQILREVGRGGMGVVYEAQQLSLGRHVAIKVLPAHALLDPRHLARFQREARSAAKLHHTNIVPVFGVGVQDGMHYFVMQFIQGLALDVVLDELRRLRLPRGQQAPSGGDVPGRAITVTRDMSADAVARSLLTGDYLVKDEGGRMKDDEKQEHSPDSSLATHPSFLSSSATIHLPGQTEGSTLSDSGNQYWQSIARIGMQVADALAHAASQGVLHRDIKPSNLLLDDTGNVWVTDFGVAKAVGDSDDLTHSGDFVGTLRYMAPERFNGRGDVRSDVYSLGLTLYELLVMRPAFQETDRSKLVKRVMHDEPVRPRKLNPSVPRDLETVTLKAIGRDPEHRYQTPAEMASDLKRFIEDRPVRARRASGAEKFWRWCRRNPLPASLLAVILLVFLTGFAGVVWQWQMAAAARDDAKRREGEAIRARDATREAQDGAITNLYHALIEEARAVRESRATGYRVRAWNLLRQALDLQTPDRDLMTLRLEAAASLGDFVGLEPVVLEGFPAEILSKAMDSDGRHVGLGLRDGTILIIDLATKKLSATLHGHHSSVAGLAFLPDGRLLSTEVAGSPKIWQFRKESGWSDAKDLSLPPEIFGVLPAPGFPFVVPLWCQATVREFAVSTDGRLLAAAQSNRIQLWNLAERTPAGSLTAGSDEQLRFPSISPHGELLCARFDNSNGAGYVVWDLIGRRLRGRLGLGLDTPYRATFSPDSRLLGCATGGGVEVFNTRALEQRLFIRGDYTQSIAFSADGQLLAIPSTQLGVVRLWNLATNREVAVLRFPGTPLGAFFTPNGKSLIATTLRACRIWNLAGAGDKRVLSGHTAGVPVVDFSPDGVLLAAGSKDKTVSIWKVATGERVHRIALPEHVQTLAFHPDGRLLALSTAGTASLWDTSTWQALADIPPEPGGEFWSLAFSPNGAYLAGSGEAGVRLWKLERAPGGPRLLPIAQPSKELAGSLCFSPDSHTLAWVERVGYERIVRLWDVNTGLGRVLPARPAHWILALALAPDGRLALTNDQLEAEWWDVAAGRRVAAYGRGELEARSGISNWSAITALSPDGAWYAVGNRAISLWDAQAGRLLLALPQENNPVIALAWSPDRSHLAVGNADGGLALWDLRAVRTQLAGLGLDW
jgi:WD40 repeat protein/serine/threonine protein kinase